MPPPASPSASAPYVLVLAGGSGERFWPLSRRARPKQLLRLFSDKTLLEETLSRLEGLVTPERILVLTNQDQESAVRGLLPQLPAENIVAEPAKRDTAAAVALAVGWVARRDPGATMLVLPADHVIRDGAAFRRDLHAAAQAAQATRALITIGIRPTWACPGFGYIELGERADFGQPADGPPFFNVAAFREKPAPELAQIFLERGHYRWNAGMFAWTVPAVLSEFSKQMPELADFITQLKSAPDFAALVAARFAALPKISLDYAIMEGAGHVLCLEAGFDWDDVGTWTAVANYLQQDNHGNAANCAPTTHEAHGNIVFNDDPARTVALLGVNDLIVVQTADATLICHRHEAEKIKQLISRVPGALQ
ncbi:MAG: mannose-1-phosphate guanylyltransferase [Verrucomicrobia bacterium]|nr:mannose-1-phosphate guanylyltransferase [Verrucomicrobiota bacterium]MBV9658677.1 mannose-1-phosphate guanylyltransferase [Verrucomicrobiota bacterium]